MRHRSVGRLLVTSILIILTAFGFPLKAYAAQVPGLAEKFQVLGELGIEVSAETQLSLQQSLSEMKAMWDTLRIDVTQLSSYPILLSMLGTGTYDEETQSFVPFTNAVYAFDAECYDIVGAYGDFLLAASGLSNGEIQVADYHSEVDEDTFMAGFGTQEVAFTLNGKPCRFTARFYYDWLDCTIIDYVNDILAEQNADKRLWCMYDGGQGFVLLYNTPEWAQEFTRRTGCPLATKASEAL